MHPHKFITLKCKCGNTYFSRVNEFHYRPILGLAQALDRYYCHGCKTTFSMEEMQKLGEILHGKTTDQE